MLNKCILSNTSLKRIVQKDQYIVFIEIGQVLDFLKLICDLKKNISSTFLN